ncbi:MAG: geranylgeranylglycerol-phosphate geranylgeranyltransferase [Bacteroidia bacterium]|nr:geranylgeranylglycerol-phosphate geranylgeranyltransferase [Bacteroidia bacterium]MDW8300885.1 geranylgeranylglycerol-phosphate geranylgeranyltransferase [Bacteroidia bacterium]
MLFRPINVLMIGMTVILGAYYVNRGVDFMFHKIFYLYVLGTMCIGAGGYVINDVFDVEIDKYNRPDTNIIGERISVSMGYAISVFLFALGLTLLYFTKNFSVFLIGLVAVISLYLYSKYFKKSLWIGNWIIALLAMFNVWVGGMYFFLSKNILWMGAFAFLITLIREIVKDMEDVYGDALGGAFTLPMLVGMEKVKEIVHFLCIVLVVLLLASLVFLEYNVIFIFVNIVLVQMPLLYCLTLLYRAKYNEDFAQISTYLKIVMIGGMIMGMQLA